MTDAEYGRTSLEDALSFSTQHKYSNSKLYARDKEIDLLLAAYARSKCSCEQNEIVLIQGPSGTGKTALACSLQPHVIQEGGFFLSGKFELSQSQDPYAVFVSAMSQVTDFVAGTDRSPPDDRLPLIQTRIQQAVGQEGGLLTQMFPSLVKIVGDQEKKTESVAGSEAKHRFHFIFSQFIRAISTIAPLVLFIDDIQWADQSSFELLQALFQLGQQSLSTNSSHSLLYVFAFREAGIINNSSIDDASSAPLCILQLSSFLESTKNTCNNTTEIKLENFDVSQLNDVISGILPSPIESTRLLTQTVFDRSRGNIFHALQILKQLQADHDLSCDPDSESWTWRDDDRSEGTTEVAASDSVLPRVLNQLSSFTLKVLQVAACMADELDEAALTVSMDNQAYEVIQSINEATEVELLVHPSTGRFRFSHDRIRQAVLSTIEDVDAFSFQIGYQLMKQASASLLDTIVFTVVNLINRGAHLLLDQAERYQVANLNLEAGLKAVSSAAFPDAARYFEAGISFLKGSDYWTENYKQALDLFDGAADAQLCCQNFERVAELVTETIDHARSESDKIRAYVIRIHAIGQHGNVQDAINVGVKVLANLGETMVPQPGKVRIICDIVKTKNLLKGRTSDAMLALPVMKDELKHGVVHVLSVLIPYTFQAGLPLTVLVGTRLVQLCLKFGMCKECSLGFVTVSWIIANADTKERYRIGRVGLSIVEKLGARSLIPRTYIPFYFFTSHWIRPLKESLAPLQNAFRLALEIGDVEYAMYAAFFHLTLAFCSGMALPLVAKLLVDAQCQMRMYKQDNILEICDQLRQFVHSIATCHDDEPTILAGDDTNDNMATSSNVSAKLFRATLSTMRAHLFGDLDLAERFAHDHRSLKKVHSSLYMTSFDELLKGVIAVGQARRGCRRRRNMAIASRCLRKMRAFAIDCPDNFLNKQKLLEAEIYSLSSRNSTEPQSNQLYGEAYRMALDQGFTYEAALACELAGDFMHEHENLGLAKEYWQQGYELYVEWGAAAKARHFRVRIDARSNNNND